MNEDDALGGDGNGGSMELSGVEMAVVGLGVSGEAAARLALSKGADVYVSDSRTDDAVAARGAHLRVAGAEVDVGRHDLDRLARAGLVVVSPGIAPDAPVLVALAERGVRWISEPELAARFLAGSLIAVTGTNGKTTTTLLVEHLLRAAGIRVAAGGNVGGGLAPAASDLARDPEPRDWYVLEMSSFQLAGVETFRPDIGVVTNLSPDHLDRYRTVEAYYADKARLFDNADESSRWVLPVEREDVASLIGDAAGERYFFGEGSGSSAFVADTTLTLLMDGHIEALCEVTEVPLLGRHNIQNALAAALTARLAGASAEGIADGLRTAPQLPHRLAPVADRDGVLWVNDSKATNVAATRSALESLERPVVLLLGGKDKGEDFGLLAPLVSMNVRSIVAFGQAGPRIVAELREALAAEGVPTFTHANGGDGERLSLVLVEGGLPEVVERARLLARPGDVVLLSPACSSFDMFESYEHRGRAFTELVAGSA